jgi:RNA polymerase sigma-70 factor, ECF subfamily
MASQDELTQGRNERFLALLKPIYVDCQRWAYRYTGNARDAEDVLSQAVLMALEHFHQLRDEGAFKTWMFRIISNSFKLWLRANKRQPEAIDPDIIPRVSTAKDNWREREDVAEAINAALAKLSPEQREALILFELHGMSIKEVCEVMGKKDSAIRVLLHRSRARLKELLRLEGIEWSGSGV